LESSNPEIDNVLNVLNNAEEKNNVLSTIYKNDNKSNNLNNENYSTDYIITKTKNSNFGNSYLFNFDSSNNKWKEENISFKKIEKSEIIFKINYRKILIVDDEELMNKSIKKLLENIIYEKKLEISIIQCNDGIDLIKEVIDDQKNGNLIDLIITDENMEYINGTQALNILIDLELSNKVKIPYVISSTTEILNIETMKLLKIEKNLPKPITKNSLINVLKDLKFFE
jgi:CheY-like chemotaxis protein